MMRTIITFIGFCLLSSGMLFSDEEGPKKTDRVRARELGVVVGGMRTGALNSITDVKGVKVGHLSLIEGQDVRTGVTAVLPHDGNIFKDKVPAAIYVYNGFGKLAGLSQVEELGNIETPIVLTNTLSVGHAVAAVVNYTLMREGNENVRSVNAVVGETNDGYLNDIRGMNVKEEDVMRAIESAAFGEVAEGSVGAGVGTRAFGYKGGIGSSSRITPKKGDGCYTVGVLVQSNFGWILNINGAPFTSEIKHQEKIGKEDGSCMIVVATDAPLSVRNLKRLAKRSFSGLSRTRSMISNGSGDYCIAFSTAYRISNNPKDGTVENPPLVSNNEMNPLFLAVEEATQEAIYNSLFMAKDVTGHKGRCLKAIPLDKVRAVIKKYNLDDLQKKLDLKLFR